MRKKRSRSIGERGDSDHFRIILPPEARWETRVAIAHTISEWKFKQEEFNQRCAYCGIHKRDTPEGYLTRDHRVPICDGGTDRIDNIVPACKRCNFLKYDLSPDDPMVPVARPRRRHRPWIGI